MTINLFPRYSVIKQKPPLSVGSFLKAMEKVDQDASNVEMYIDRVEIQIDDVGFTVALPVYEILYFQANQETGFLEAEGTAKFEVPAFGYKCQAKLKASLNPKTAELRCDSSDFQIVTHDEEIAELPKKSSVIGWGYGVRYAYNRKKP